MSLVHVLVIPRRRIYNAVTLTAADVPLVNHMRQVGWAAVRALLRADGHDEHGCVSPLASVPTTLGELEAAPYLPGGLNLGEAAAAKLGGNGSVGAPTTTFHVHPQQTIGWLHLHATCGKLRTSAFAYMEDKARCEADWPDSAEPVSLTTDTQLTHCRHARAPSAAERASPKTSVPRIL